MNASHSPHQLSFAFYEASEAVVTAAVECASGVALAGASQVHVVSLSNFRQKKAREENISLHRTILETIAHMA